MGPFNDLERQLGNKFNSLPLTNEKYKSYMVYIAKNVSKLYKGFRENRTYLWFGDFLKRSKIQKSINKRIDLIISKLKYLGRINSVKMSKLGFSPMTPYPVHIIVPI